MRAIDPQTKENLEKMVTKVLITFGKQHAKYISNMRNWLSINNIGNIDDNMNLRAVVDVMFKCTTGRSGINGGAWYPIDNGKSVKTLADEAYNHWNKKLSNKK